MTAPHPLRCPPMDMKDLEDRVRRWKQAGYTTFSIPVDELLDIIKSPAKSSEKVLEELEKYIDEMYPVPPKEGDYLYPSRKGRRETYDQIRGVIKELRQQEMKE